MKFTYTVELGEVLGLLVCHFFDSVGVLKHVEFVNQVELDFAKVRKIVCFLSLFPSVATFLVLSQPLVDFVFDGRVPAPDLAVVKGSEDYTSRVERCKLKRSNSIFGAV